MEKPFIIKIGNQEITVKGLMFSKFFGALTLVTMILVILASIKYIIP